MSMTLLTILQLVELFIIYTVMTVLLPAAIFHKLLIKQRTIVRFMTYVVIGNFYTINLVLLLELLHISNPYTLWTFTLIPSAAVGVLINKVPIINNLKFAFAYIVKLILGYMGWRSFLRRIFEWIRTKIKKLGSLIRRLTHNHWLEWLLCIGLVGCLFWIYGSNALHTYGYTFSDLPRHNLWINEMGNNNLFADGIYPFGFHCIIYYIHAMFGIDNYVLLRLFWLVQTVYIHLILFAFIKACCKTRFAPYIGVGMYILLDIYQMDCTKRYVGSLPQEFGMIFILPGIYFALAYFYEKKKEIDSEWIVSKKKNKEIKKERKAYLHSLKFKEGIRVRLKEMPLSTKYLIGYTISFSLSLIVHFYDTMIAGLFCVAIALAFSHRFFTKRYFGQVMTAFFLSIFIAALPMVISYAAGTPLEGSLFWGLGVMKGEESEQTKDNAEPQQKLQSSDNKKDQINNDLNTSISNQEDTIITLDDWLKAKARVISEKTTYYLQKTYSSINEMVTIFVVTEKYNNFLILNMIGVGWLILFAFISFFQKRYDYGATLISCSIYIGFLFILLATRKLGLPGLMHYDRCRMYLAYSIPILWSFIIDAPVYALFGSFKKKWVMYVASLTCCSAVGSYFLINEPIRTPVVLEGLETNAAITCLTDIIHDNEDFKWTIVSANDELNMAIDHGRHYEISTFLKGMESSGYKSNIKITTRYVYFFIEKIPIDYTVHYENSGQRVSWKGAKMALPKAGGLVDYEGENRWIVMSRMYYWAKAYQKMYSNEMKVFYEDDTFVCYKIEQNEYSLNNFAIDYGFNMKESMAK